MKKLLALLFLLPALAFGQTLIMCGSAPCNTTSPSGGVGSWDPAWLAYGKINSALPVGSTVPNAALPFSFPETAWTGSTPSTSFYGQVVLGGPMSGVNIYLGTNSSTDLGAIEATCYGLYTCGSNGWSLLLGESPSPLGGTGMGSAGANPGGVENTAIGFLSMSQMTTGSYNTGVGVSTLGHETTGSGNVAVGEDSGRNLINVQRFVAVGSSSGRNGTGSSDNVAIGYNAMMGVDTKPENSSSQVGSFNVAIGSFALDAYTTAADTVAVGYNAGTAVTTATGDTFVGASAGAAVTTGTGNTFVGWNAGLTESTTTSNTFVGTGAGQLNTSSGSTCIGAQACQHATGANNTVIGSNTGATTLTTGANNILIGYSSAVDAVTATVTKELNIGNAIRGSMGLPTLSSCGTSPVMNANATGLGGAFQTGTGATACTVTFPGYANSNAPACLVMTSGGVPPFTTADNGTTATLTLTTAAASTVYDYVCIVH